MPRKALVVGINHYDGSRMRSLKGCVGDANAMKSVLQHHGDGSINFEVKLMTDTGLGDVIQRTHLKDAVYDLFASSGEVALFYFAGHGHIEATGSYLCTSDCRIGDEGLPLGDVLTYANQSKAENKVIILDCCHSGHAGASASALSEGLTILSSSAAEQYTVEVEGGGIFTTLLVDALNGAAANLVGEVTAAGVYAHIDQALGAWEQHPVFKANVRSFVSLRKVRPAVSLADLRRITEFFPTPDSSFLVEPEGPAPDPAKIAIYAVLRRYSRVNLLVSDMRSKTCSLTVLGKHYWRLVASERI